VSRGQQLKLVLFGALAIGVLATMTGRGTLAYFTTQVTSTGNTFSAGNLHFSITDNNQTGAGLTAVTSSITLSNMKPGDSVYAPMKVTNIGSLDAQYGIKYAATGGTSDLTSHLKISLVGRGSGAGVNADCLSTSFTDVTKWKEQIAPTLATMAASHTFVNSASTTGPITDGAWVAGDTTAGAYLALDHTGATSGLDTDVLCVEVNFPDAGAPLSLTTEDNTYNDASAGTWSTTLVFTLDGQQRHHPVEFDQPTAPTTGNY
jgi:predicted ribosomally synthesized peptide with SipW-like signal peptide